ncbi:hypothetical protein EVAR_96094_1 [Eumeta japonica]|uniref:Uncharacterized protein n=1 Tax=Eumeta variegata TaxID=151549 RepID=A0A4C1VCH2_EUMVA|nr:hypothetical protein EVAR_96094_1 [Eumeta japonica]
MSLYEFYFRNASNTYAVEYQGNTSEGRLCDINIGGPHMVGPLTADGNHSQAQVSGARYGRHVNPMVPLVSIATVTTVVSGLPILAGGGESLKVRTSRAEIKEYLGIVGECISAVV